MEIAGSYGEVISMKQVFKEGDLKTKLSFLIMGFSNLLNKQIFKGILFLLAEIFFIIACIYQIIPGIVGLITLGTKTQGMQWQTIDGIRMKVSVEGDNSMLLMIYGLAAIIFCGIFFYVYWCSLKSNRKLFVLNKEHKSIPSFREDLKTLTNGRFHMTLMIIPLIGVLLFTILPLVYMIGLAFTNYDHNHLPPGHLFDWVGFANFRNILTGRMAETFMPLLSWTLIWAVAATATNFFFGILLALLINTKGLRGKKIFRTIFVIAMAVPQFVSLLIMRNLLADWGPVNALLERWGLISNALPFLSDGANKFQVFRSITFPQILLIMTPNLIQQFIGNINNFNVIYLLTEGKPNNSALYQAGDTDLLVTWLYKLTVIASDYNLASVIGIIIFVLSAVFSLLAYTRSKSYEGGLQ